MFIESPNPVISSPPVLGWHIPFMSVYPDGQVIVGAIVHILSLRT